MLDARMQNFLYSLGAGGNKSSTGGTSQQPNAGTDTSEEEYQQHQHQHQQLTDQQKYMAQLQMQNQATLFEGLSNPSYLAQLSMLHQQQQQQQQQHQAAAAAQAAAVSMAENSLGLHHQSSASQHRFGAAHALAGFDESTANTLAGFRNSHLYQGNPLAGAGGLGSYADSNRLLLRQLLQANSNAASPLSSSTWSMGGGIHTSVPASSDLYAEHGMLGPWSATSAGVLDKIAKLDREEASTKKKVVRRKPKDRPKRPLSAYNIFFKEERKKILSEIPDEDAAEGADEEDSAAGDKAAGPAGTKRKKSPHGKIGFESLAKTIGSRWKSLEGEQAAYYKFKAAEDMGRYKKEMEVFLAKQADKKKAEEEQSDEGAPVKSEEEGASTKGASNVKGVEETSEPQSKRVKVAVAESGK
jgi:hypothetical protein